MALVWVLKDASGEAMRSTETFDSREEAESWMGAEWSALRAEGAASVALTDDGIEIYDMSLDEA